MRKITLMFAALSVSAMAQKIDWSSQVKNKPVIDVRDYGAKGNGTTNDAAAINAAIQAAPVGATVVIPHSSSGFLLSGSGSQLILVDRGINLECIGPLKVAASVPGTTDVIRVYGPIDQWSSIKGCHITPVSGTPARHAINIDATSATNGERYIARLVIERNTLGGFGGYGIKFTFPTQYDGLFNSYIHHNSIKNGLDCARCGDTIDISYNTFTGRAGIVMQSLFGAGANRISHNSLVSCPPAIRVINASGLVITNNNIEPNIGADASCTLQDASVQIEGTLTNDGIYTGSGAAVGNVITDNTFVMIPLTTKYGLKLGQYSRGTIVRGNRYGLGSTWDGSTPQKGIWVDSGATDYMIGPDYIDYITDWTMYIQNDYTLGGHVITRHDEATDYLYGGPIRFGPNGYASWQFKSNFLEQLTGLPFASLPSPTGKKMVTWCDDCNVATPCTSGGSGAWAFSNGTAWKCPF